MSKSDILLNRINWNNSPQKLRTDLELWYKMRLRTKASEDDTGAVWSSIIERNCIAAVLLLDTLSHSGIILETDKELVIQKLKQNLFEKIESSEGIEQLESCFLISVLINAGKASIDSLIQDKLPLEAEEDFCNNVFALINITAERYSNLISAIIRLYKLFSQEAFRKALKGCNLPSPERADDNLIQFLHEITRQGAFGFVITMIKTFNIDLSQVGIHRWEIYDGLHECEEQYYIRGISLYKKIIDLEIDDKENALKEWFESINKIDTQIVRDNMDNVLFMYICNEIILNPKDPLIKIKTLLKGNIYNIRELNLSRINIPTFTKLYRRTIQSLIYNNSNGFTRDFIKAVGDYNIDQFRPKAHVPAGIRDQLKADINPEVILNALVTNTNNTDEAVYIYLNSFVRGIVSLDGFINGLLIKYDVSSIKSAFQRYHFGIKVYRDNNTDIIYSVPVGIKKGKSQFVDKESAEIIINQIKYDEIYAAKMNSINPVSHIIKFVILGLEEYRFNHIRKLLKIARQTSNVDEEIQNVAQSINLNVVRITSSEYIEFCIELLDTLTILALKHKNTAVASLLDMIHNANYFSYSIYASDSARKLKIPEETNAFTRISKACKRLQNAYIVTNRCYLIYSNTIMRRGITLSLFLKYFVYDTLQSYDDLFESISTLSGTIQGFINDDKDENVQLVFISSNAFCMTSYQNDGVKQDKYIYKVDKKGKSATSIRKEYGIAIGAKVLFELASFDGENTFEVKNVKVI